jgi:DNA-directed RNA polymerase alpha subunit/DNA-directed RNA polymerase subunit L
METKLILKSQNTETNPSDWKTYHSSLINKGHYLDTSFVNGLRRYAISNINTVAFEYSPTPMLRDYIIFHKNTSNMNNDFIGHRIGLVPVNIIGIKYILLIYKILIGHHSELNKILKTIEDPSKKNENINILKNNLKLQENIDLISKIKFYIDIENTNDDIINITTENILFLFEHEIKMDDLKQYKLLLELYEEYNNISNSIANDISIQNLLKIVFSYIYETPDISQKGILLCKLKQKEKLKCEMYLNIGNGEKHARWSVVSPCTYSFELDNDLILEILNKKCIEANLINDKLKNDIGEDDYKLVENFIETRYNDISKFTLNSESVTSKNEFLTSSEFTNLSNNKTVKQYISDKDILLNTFNKCDYQRYYKGKEEYELFNREFILEIESVGFYECDKILNKTFKLLKNNLLIECNKIIYLLSNYTNLPIKNEDIIISESNKIENGIDILFTKSNHSIGNILTSYIYHLRYKFLSYIAYKMVHPLKTEMLITIGLDIEDKTNSIINIFSNLIDIFNKMELSTFKS